MKKSNNKTVELGQYNIPTKWEEVTLKQFQQILELENKNDNLAILAIMLNKTKEEVQQLPSKVLTLFYQNLNFFKEEPKVEADNKLTINDELYVINDKDNMKVGEYADFNEILQYDRNNYAYMLAILCRKEGEVYDDKFIAEKLNKRKEMFENIPVTEALKTVNFFFQKFISLKTNTMNYSTALKEEVESLIVASIKDLRKNGGFIKPSNLRAIMKLKKLKKQLKSI